MQLYLIAGMLAICLLAVFFGGRWLYKRGKEAGRKELEADVKKWLAEHDQAIYAAIMSGDDSPFGSVQNPDAVWGGTPTP